MSKSRIREIVLSASRGSWRMMSPHASESDRRYHEIREKVLTRDNHTCQFCGFRAKRFQELHHIDDNHGNNSPENVVTACCLCHQCFHLGMAGVRSSGVIVWLPEFSQADISNLSRILFVAMANGGKNAEPASELYRALEARRAIVDLEMGQGASNPAALGQAFLDMDKKAYGTRAARLGGLRLLPRMQSFAVQVAYWRADAEVFGKLGDSKWAQVMSPELRASIERTRSGESTDQLDEADGFNGGSGSEFA